MSFKLEPVSSFSIKKNAVKEYISHNPDGNFRTLQFIQKVLSESTAIEDSIFLDSLKKAPSHKLIEPIRERAIDTTKVYDQMPEYPGGDTALLSFVAININYPRELQEKDIEGKVIVGFTLSEDGSISDLNIIKSVHPVLDAEALRIVRLFPKHRPVFQKGAAVKVKMQVPVNFRIREVNSFY